MKKFAGNLLDAVQEVCYNSKLREKFFANFAMQRQRSNRRKERVSEALTAKEKVVGLKQTRRAVSTAQAVRVYLACDAEERLIQPLLEACHQAGIPVETSYTMKQLGKECGIDVSTAAVALLAK